MGRVFLAMQEVTQGILKPSEALNTQHGRVALNYLAAQRKKKQVPSETRARRPVSDPNCWRKRSDIEGIDEEEAGA